MRKLMVLSFITVDGVMQAPGGPEEDTSGGFTYGGWQAPYLDEFLGKVLDEQWREPFDLLLGRKTFEIFASYWPYCDLPNVLAASDTIWFKKKLDMIWVNFISGPDCKCDD
jgi:dihydrofolate reductase